MFIDRKEKSITRATVMKAYGKVVEMDGVVKGPKTLGTFGASYTTSTFSGWVSQYEVPADLTVTELRFYITAGEDHVTKVRVMMAIGERADSAICFQTYLDVEIQPGEERLVSCLIPHGKLQQGETIFIGVDANVVCSQRFGYKEYDESVSWYVISGAFKPMENHGNGSHKKLYMEMLGFDQGVFTTDHLLDVTEALSS